MVEFTRRTLGDEDYALLSQGIGRILVEGGEPYWINRYRPDEMQCSNYSARVVGRDVSYKLSLSAHREDEWGWGASYPHVFRLDQLEEAANIGERYLQEIAAGARFSHLHIQRRAIEHDRMKFIWAQNDGKGAEEWLPMDVFDRVYRKNGGWWTQHHEGWLFKVELGGPHYAITYCDEYGVAQLSWPIARSFTFPVSDAAGKVGVIHFPTIASDYSAIHAYEQRSQEDRAQEQSALMEQYAKLYSTAPLDQRGVSSTDRHGWFTCAGNPYLCRISYRRILQDPEKPYGGYTGVRNELDLLGELYDPESRGEPGYYESWHEACERQMGGKRLGEERVWDIEVWREQRGWVR
jgi:hypothetical protein